MQPCSCNHGSGDLFDKAGSLMSQPTFPRLSDAMQFLPMLRSQLEHAATTHLYPMALRVEFRPIVEDGLFGFELDTDAAATTYVVIGRAAQGEPAVRSSRYRGDARTLRLATRDGITLSPMQAHRQRPTHQERCCESWEIAAEQAWAALARAFPGNHVHPMVMNTVMQRSLEGALSIAYSHVARWDPFVHFYGLPNEAQHGFRLSSTVPGEYGELIFQRPDIWMLRWKAPPAAVYESWSVVVQQDEVQLGQRNDIA